MKMYCNECGYCLDFQYGKDTAYCPICNKEIKIKETIPGYIVDARIAQLKS